MQKKREKLKEAGEKIKDLMFLGAFWVCLAPALAIAWMKYQRELSRKEKTGRD